MEAIQDASVEPAVLWLVQSILANLLLDKLDAWLRLVGLADKTEKLKLEIERVEAMVAAARGRAAWNKPLARSLARLKELLYDADDVVDELDYYRLQHQVERDTLICDGDGDGAEQVDSTHNNAMPSSSRRKKQSKSWDEFEDYERTPDGKRTKAKCIHCKTVVGCESNRQGTSAMVNHLRRCKRKRAETEQTQNPPSASDGAQNIGTVWTHDSDSRKRMRTHEVSSNTHPWNKAEFCCRIQQTTRQLQDAISEVQKLYGLESVAGLNLCQNSFVDPCRRTSSVVQRKIYGRDAEKNSIIKLMTEQKSDSVTVLPIVGIGGIGKTAFAQLVYNDPTVKHQFELRIWVWVSNNFDEMRLTREML